MASTGPSIVVALRRSTGTRPRRWLVAGTALVAAVIAAGIATSPHHSLIDIATPVLSVVSIFVPYVGILLMSDLRRPRTTDALGPSMVAAVLVGAALGAFGVIASIIAAAVAGSDGLSEAWVAPYEVARHLLAEQISAIVWAQWLVVAVLWGGILNAVGARRRLAIEP